MGAGEISSPTEAKGYRQGSIEVKAQLSDKAAPRRTLLIARVLLLDAQGAEHDWAPRKPQDSRSLFRLPRHTRRGHS